MIGVNLAEARAEDDSLAGLYWRGAAPKREGPAPVIEALRWLRNCVQNVARDQEHSIFSEERGEVDGVRHPEDPLEEASSLVQPQNLVVISLQEDQVARDADIHDAHFPQVQLLPEDLEPNPFKDFRDQQRDIHLLEFHQPLLIPWPVGSHALPTRCHGPVSHECVYRL